MTRNLSDDDTTRLILMELDEDTLACMGQALPTLRDLYDHLERKLLDASAAGDEAKLVLYAWLYGRVAAMVTEIETGIGP